MMVLIMAKVQIQYKQTGDLQRLGQQLHEQQVDTLMDLRRRIETLQGGAWVSSGANRFFDEMDNEVFPTLERLNKALAVLTTDVATIVQQFQAFETEAGSLFSQGDQIQTRATLQNAETDHGGSREPDDPYDQLNSFKETIFHPFWGPYYSNVDGFELVESERAVGQIWHQAASIAYATEGINLASLAASGRFNSLPLETVNSILRDENYFPGIEHPLDVSLSNNAVHQPYALFLRFVEEETGYPLAPQTTRQFMQYESLYLDALMNEYPQALDKTIFFYMAYLSATPSGDIAPHIQDLNRILESGSGFWSNN